VIDPRYRNPSPSIANWTGWLTGPLMIGCYSCTVVKNKHDGRASCAARAKLYLSPCRCRPKYIYMCSLNLPLPSQHHHSSIFFTSLKFKPNLHGFSSAMIVTDSQSFALSLKIPRVSTELFPYLPLRFKANSFSPDEQTMERPNTADEATLPTKKPLQVKVIL
jgi:hypothetical protein